MDIQTYQITSIYQALTANNSCLEINIFEDIQISTYKYTHFCPAGNHPGTLNGVKSSRPMWQLGTDNLTNETTRPLWQLDLKNTQPTRQLNPRDNSTLVTTRPSWQFDPRDHSTSCDNSTRTTRPNLSLYFPRKKLVHALLYGRALVEL